ncbi:hypothetical protein EKM02_09950 [Flavobacterium sp. RSP49]|uniref:hypothetical protein n=1 Tax=Flavobacterium sp. RSP49 TaxID=2497487 RepID=UPI000F84159B|nr:hypothetical protein [Flavobacterium sp. RSP49]RTY99501.1 hypothetical protein EKM02_09950 [Flavobacterium sp. RSP49]
MKKIVILIATFGLFACNQQKDKGNQQGDWIKGTEAEQIRTIEKQFRGFDYAMLETGYRYQELFWAGQDQNWEYAEYQIDKIETAIKNGLERRPKRAASADHFLTVILPKMKNSIQSKDPVIFNKEFENVTINCNRCHAMENVPFFTIKTPIDRQSPIRK